MKNKGQVRRGGVLSVLCLCLFGGFGGFKGLSECGGMEVRDMSDCSKCETWGRSESHVRQLVRTAVVT
ncbi:hypothetical protein V6Z11_A05G084800 [Gossypium hirsutum]